MYFVQIPDEQEAFFAFVNNVINYRDHKEGYVGPYQVSTQQNKEGDSFFVTENRKEKRFLQMIVDQFYALAENINLLNSLCHEKKN